MKRAFTLIELLVVIAIIAILAAILFPVFAQAKLAAKKTAGLSQVKQIGTSVHIYLSDYDDVLMPYRFGSSSGPIVNPHYLAGEPRTAVWDANGEQGRNTKRAIFFSDMLAPYIKNEQIWNAPGYSNAWSVIQDKGTWDPNFHSYGGQNSYAANNYLMKSGVGTATSEIVEVSNTLLFVDATYYNALPAQPLPVGTWCKLGGYNPGYNTYSHYWKHLGNNFHNFNSPGDPNPDAASNNGVWANINARYSGVLNVVRADSSGKAMNAKQLVYDLRAKLDQSIWNHLKTPCEP